MREKEADQPPYNIWSNIIYVYHHVWKWDKSIFLICILNGLCTAIIPFIWVLAPKFLIDELMNGKSLESILMILGVTLVGAVLTHYGKGYATGAYRMKISLIRFKYIDLIHEKAMGMDFKHTEDESVLKEIHQAWRIVRNPFQGVGGILRMTFTLPGILLGFIGYVAIIFSLHPLVLIYLLLNVSIIYFINSRINTFEKSKEKVRSDYHRKAYYSEKTMSDFKYGKDIRVYGMKDLLIHKKKKYDEKNHRMTKEIEIKRLKGALVDSFLLSLREGIIYVYLIFRVVASGLSIGNFTMYVGSIRGFASWMENLIKDVAHLKTCCYYVKDLRSFLDIEEEELPEDVLEIPERKPYKITFENVSFKYPRSERYIYENLSFTIEPGQKIALVGINGAGKTTLVKLITGLYMPTKGRILLNGMDISKMNKKAYYRLFSVVFQEINMFAFTLKENIALTVNPDMKALEEAVIKADMLDKVNSLEKGFDTNVLKVIDEEGIEFSGGENQRLALARALYKNGDIMILDEPTAALDPLAEHHIYESFNKIIEARTAVYISHRLSSTRFCDKILFMEDGKIKEEGTHEELMEQGGSYAHMFNVQAKYYQENIDENVNEEKGA